MDHERLDHEGTKQHEENEMVMGAAVELVGVIDENLERGTRHYRGRGGKLLVSLEEVVRAILADELEGYLPHGCTGYTG